MVRSLAMVLVLTLSSAASAAPAFDLVPPTVCLAGDRGTSAQAWRVQVGFFEDRDLAFALAQQLEAGGLTAEVYTAAWFPETEPLVVVSGAYPSRKAAERAARRYRKVAGDALVRRFTVWSR